MTANKERKSTINWSEMPRTPYDDQNKTWRVMYRVDDDAIVILEVFEKKAKKTPREVIENCKRRIRLYDT